MRPIELEPRAGLCWNTEDRLDHVIGHLRQNALDATSWRESVRVRLFRDGAFVVLEVTDSGSGMTAEFVRDRLFKPFEHARKRPGWASESMKVRSTWRRLAARLTVEKRAQRGHLRSRAFAGRRQYPHPSRKGRGRRMSETRRPLLIVEDDPALQKQMRWAFDKYETVFAADRENSDRAVAPVRARGRHDGPGPAAAPGRSHAGFAAAGRESIALAPDTKVIVLTDRPTAATRCGPSHSARTISARSRSSPNSSPGRSTGRIGCMNCRRRIGACNLCSSRPRCPGSSPGTRKCIVSAARSKGWRRRRPRC